ncbi:class I adenylate-forming enzyme family protein [Nocardia sp. NPDC052254]|uniref:class I adenylate-forming enzyme family protein n=1 Tax=Nocardia sp. NPDC052254 TaxID=3155681 RepID=UPI003441B8AB
MTDTDTVATMDGLIRARAAAAPDATMVVDPGSYLTYAELDTATQNLAATLIGRGVGKGTRVGLLMPNGTEWVRFAVAVTRIGAVLVPLSTLLRPPELRTQLRVAAVQYLIAVEEFRGRRHLDELELTPAREPMPPDPALPALRGVQLAADLLTETPDHRAAAVLDALTATVTPADPLAVMFTSGSRGMPKGVIHSHGNAFGAVRSGLASRCVDAGTRLYLPMPLFWVGGFGGGLLSALAAGATLVTEATPTDRSTLALLRDHGVTLFRGWPDQARTLARRAGELGVEIPPLHAGSLDAMLPPDRRPRPGARANLFGMTESFGPYCGYPADTDMRPAAWGSCGRPFGGMEVRIANPEDGLPVPPGEVGVIQLRGPHTLRGMCRRGREQLFTRDGFYSTGDLGHVDDAGFLFHHGRSDDMVKISGATVYPTEVEAALRTLAGVSAAFVTDIAAPQGICVAAAVVCDTATITVVRLRRAAREVLSSFKIPTVWLLLNSEDAIPRGSTGKVDIHGLRDMLAAAAR